MCVRQYKNHWTDSQVVKLYDIFQCDYKVDSNNGYLARRHIYTYVHILGCTVAKNASNSSNRHFSLSIVVLRQWTKNEWNCQYCYIVHVMWSLCCFLLLLLRSVRISRCGIRYGTNIVKQFPCVLSLTNITHIKKIRVFAWLFFDSEVKCFFSIYGKSKQMHLQCVVSSVLISYSFVPLKLNLI